MSEELNKVIEASLDKWDQGAGVIQRLLEVAHPSAVFGEPITEGEHTIITASEVSAGMGFGFGIGGGSGFGSSEEEPSDEEEPEPEAEEGAAEGGGTGAGGGGGGGGGVASRPVAVISVGPEGVSIKPVVDVTKLGLALLTTVGAMAAMRYRIMRASRRM